MIIIGGVKMNPEISKKQNKKVIIFAVVLSFLSIGLLVFGFSLVSSDKVVMLQSISNLSNKLGSFLEDDNSLLDKLATSKDIGIKSEWSISTDDMKASLSFDYLENKGDNKSNLILNANMNDEEILDANLSLGDDNIYLFLEGITPNYYHLPLEYVSFLSGLSSSDYDKIASLLKNSVTDSIENSNIKKDKVEITYQGKNKKVNRLTYAITNKMIYEMASDFISNIKKDKVLLANISSYLQQSKEEIIQEMDSFLELLNYDKEEVLYYYRIYYYGFNQIVSYELEEVDSKIILEYKIDQKESFSIREDNAIVLLVETQKNKNQYDFSGYIQIEEEKYSFTGTLTDDTMKLVVPQPESDTQYVIMIRSTKKQNGNRYQYQNHIIVSSVTKEIQTDLFTLDIDIEYYFNQKVNAHLENSIPVSEITEEDIEIIQNNILNHPLYQLFDPFINGSELSL